MDATITQTIRKFSGINNVDPATRLAPVIVDHEYVYPVQQANNVDIDNTFQVASRPGYTEVKPGTDIHSMWSDGNIWLYVDGAVLYQMDEIYGTKIIRSDLTIGARISYAPWNDRVYYMNGYQKGYVKGGADYAFTNPSREFKEPLPAGQFIEYFMGCLYVAKDNILYQSDPLCDYYDIRTGYRIFKDRITLLRGINEDGIYVVDSETWFLKGKANEDFERENINPYPAIPFTDIVVNGKFVDDGIEGDIVIWTAENGICMGDGKGKVTNITEARYTFTARGRGTGFIRENGNIRHYINSLY